LHVCFFHLFFEKSQISCFIRIVAGLQGCFAATIEGWAHVLVCVFVLKHLELQCSLLCSYFVYSLGRRAVDATAPLPQTSACGFPAPSSSDLTSQHCVFVKFTVWNFNIWTQYGVLIHDFVKQFPSNNAFLASSTQRFPQVRDG